MLQAAELSGEEHVLEVGTGSGYQAALLGELARHVVSVEVLPELASRARAVLDRLGVVNVDILVGDGHRGSPSRAPYHVIVVAAASPEVPQALIDQLALGGRLVIPIGQHRRAQQLLRITKHGAQDTETERLGGCAFVPLISVNPQLQPT